MSLTPHFYHESLRKYIIAFGTLFNGITVERGTSPTIEVPIAYGSKQKWMARMQQNPNLEQAQAVTLPRMSFIITNMMYDTERRTSPIGKLWRIDPTDSTKAKMMYHPVSYNIDVALTIYAKNMADYLQILEQIIPFFRPNFSITIEDVQDMSVIEDVRIDLNDIAVIHDSEGSFDEFRVINSDLNFTIKGLFFGPLKELPLIKRVIVDTRAGHQKFIGEDDSGATRYTVVPDPETALATDDYGYTEYYEMFPDDPPVPDP